MKVHGCALTGMALILAAGIAGCSPWATYPEMESGRNVSLGPAARPVPQLIAAAIETVHEAAQPDPDRAERLGTQDWSGYDDSFAINLPPGTPAETYEKVFELMGGGRPMLVVGEPAYHIHEIRVRGLNAEVDLIAPRADGFYDFSTIYFQNDFPNGYRSTATRRWHMSVEPPAPNYVPPPPSKKKKVEESVAEPEIPASEWEAASES